jgi:hypothetical protein
MFLTKKIKKYSTMEQEIENYPYIIVGGGIAGVSCIEQVQ